MNQHFLIPNLPIEMTRCYRGLLGIILLLFVGIGFVACGEESKEMAGATGGLQLPHSKYEIDALMKQLSSDSTSVILAALPHASGILRPDVKEKIESCLSHSDPMVREAAFDLVLPCEVTSGYPRLAERMSADFPGEFRRGSHKQQDFHFDPGGGSLSSYAGELPELSGPDLKKFEAMGEGAIPTLAKMLESGNPEIRDIAVYLLGKVRSSKVVPLMKKMLSDSEEVIKYRALASLGWLEVPEALDTLYDLRTHEDRYIVCQAANSLSWHNDERALDVWKTYLFERGGTLSEDDVVRNICRFDSRKSIPFLISGLALTSPAMRNTCASALRKITHEDFGADQAAWNNWLVASGVGKNGIYQILGEQLIKTKSKSILEQIEREGATRAIPYVLATYGEVRDRPGSGVCISDPAMRLLSAHTVLPDQPGLQPASGYPPPTKEQWSRWLQKNADRLPERSPLTTATNPLREIGSFSTAGCAKKVTVDDALLFVGGSNSLEMFDMNDVTHPTRIGSYRLDEQGVEQMKAEDGRLWISTHTGGLHLYEYNRAGDIQFVTTITHGSGMQFIINATRLLVSGKHSDLGSGAKLFDISQPSHPKLLDFCGGVAMRSYYLGGEGGFFTTANWAGSKIELSGAAPIYRMWVSGVALAENGHIYCMGDFLTIRDFDTGKLVGLAPTPQQPFPGAQAFCVWKHYAIASLKGIVIYDVSNPAEIDVVSHTTSPTGASWDCRDFCVTGNHLIGVSYDGLFRVFELPKLMRDDEL